MKRKRLLIFGLGVLCLTTVWQASTYGQTVAGETTAIGAGAGVGAAGGGGRTPSQIAAPATGAGATGLENNPGVAQGAPGAVSGGKNAASAGAGPKVKPPRSRANHWDNDNGYDMLQDLLVDRNNSSRRLSIQQKAKRANNLYHQPRNKTWLNYFPRSDRGRIQSGIWKYVTTPNDRYYYRPWAPIMRTRNPDRIIGFNSWQDAMIAGYRPDPDSWPDPAPQLLYISTITDSLELAHYVEFVYAGHVTPQTFNANFKYIRYVENLANQRPDTRKEKSTTVAHVIGAALGYNDRPKYIGGVEWEKQENERRAEEARRLREEEEERERQRSQQRYRRFSRILVGAVLGALMGAALAGD